MHLQAEASKLKKFKTGLGRRFNDIVGDMQDIRDEGLHSLNELKVEYQVLYQVPGTRYQVSSTRSAKYCSVVSFHIQVHVKGSITFRPVMSSQCDVIYIKH